MKKPNEDKNPLANALYIKLKKMIYSGELKPYRALNLTEVADILKTSLTPANSALSKLADEGLIIKSPNKTAMVAPVSIEEYREDSLTGALLEGVACYLATPRITSKEIAHLEKILKKMKDVKIQPDSPKLKALNREYHGIIVKKCGNVELLKLIKEYSWKLYRYYFLIYSLPDAISTFNAEHQLILENLKKRDPAGVRDATEKHIISAHEMIMKYFDLF